MCLLIFRPKKVIYYLICKIRAYYLTKKYIDGGGGKIQLAVPFIPVKIKKSKGAKLILNGNLKICSHFEGREAIVIKMSSNSKFELLSDFIIGNGVQIALLANSILVIGGKENESESGITAHTIIMVYRRIEIGKDFLCAWNVFITDSDWHYIKGQNHQADVKIGDHVWVANNNNILKGSIIGNNSIVASNSKIINKTFPENVLIAGLSPKIIKSNIEWSRDLV